MIFVYLIFGLASIYRLAVREPIVQRKYTQAGPEAVGSQFIRYRSAKTQVNKTLELRIDLKTVEPSYTTVPHQLKSWITGERCFRTIYYGSG